MNPFLSAIIFIFGLVVGSFLNVCIYRLPREKSIVNPGSRCPHCETPIPWYDNIPLLSYILLRGKCRHCGGKISFRYFLVELLTGSLFLLLFLNFGLSWKLAIFLPFTSAMVVVSFIDLEHLIIPDCITYPGIGLGLILSLAYPQLHKFTSPWNRFLQPPWDSLLNSISGMLLGGAILYLLAVSWKVFFKKEAMGGGDVKLLAMVGSFVGWMFTLVTIMIAAFIGALVGGTLIFLKKKARSDYIPFGPFLALGSIIIILWGERILQWYSWRMGFYY